MIRGFYWKILGVAILIYVLIAGILVPLNPGITQVNPFGHKGGDVAKLEIQGYNTHFDQASNIQAWLVLDKENSIKGNEINVIHSNKIEISFDLPTHFPKKQLVTDLSLIVNTDNDGAFVRPSAITLTQSEIKVPESITDWTKDPVTDLNQLDAFRFPFRNILVETIRNTYFHVPMWFSMIILFFISFIYSIFYLRNPQAGMDDKIRSLVLVGVLFGILGTLTGAVWAKFTWGAYWSWDVKQNMTAVCLLIYFAYFLLRQSITDQDRRARVSAAYNLFAFIAMIPLLFIIPRLTESLHPGNGGNPALGGEDLDNTMRMIFYPSIIGWTLFGLWMAELYYRYAGVERRINEQALE